MLVKQNFKYSLPVYERDREVLIGSEIEPVALGDTIESKSWDNGPTIYTKKYVSKYSLVIQDGKPILIIEFWEEGDYASQDSSWEAYECTYLPSGKGVFRWTLEDKDED